MAGNRDAVGLALLSGVVGGFAQAFAAPLTGGLGDLALPSMIAAALPSIGTGLFVFILVLGYLRWTRAKTAPKGAHLVFDGPPKPVDAKWANLGREIASSFVFPTSRLVGPEGFRPFKGLSSSADGIHANGEPAAGNAWREWVKLWGPLWDAAYGDLERRASNISDTMTRQELFEMFNAYATVAKRLMELDGAMRTFGGNFGKHPSMAAWYPEKQKEVRDLLKACQTLNDKLRAADSRLTFPVEGVV